VTPEKATLTCTPLAVGDAWQGFLKPQPGSACIIKEFQINVLP
jgi:hypothetical protein